MFPVIPGQHGIVQIFCDPVTAFRVSRQQDILSNIAGAQMDMVLFFSQSLFIFV
jgi:hypothetical protein